MFGFGALRESKAGERSCGRIGSCTPCFGFQAAFQKELRHWVLLVFSTELPKRAAATAAALPAPSAAEDGVCPAVRAFPLL